MGILASILGLGPITIGAIILALLLIFSFSPSLAPYMPYVSILLPAALLSTIAWRRGYYAAVSWLSRGASAYEFWHAAAPELGWMADRYTKNRIREDGETRKEERTLIFCDRKRSKGYACKVLRVADVQKNYETTTQRERMLLLDRMVRTIEGLGDVEAKLVVERDPEGEKAQILLWAEVIGGDEEGARHAVEHAAKLLAKGMEKLGMTLLDDITYAGYSMRFKLRMPKPSLGHLPLLAASSLATFLLSICSAEVGTLSATTAIAGLMGLLLTGKLLLDARKASCQGCGGAHVHWSLANPDGDLRYSFMDGGVLLTSNGKESVASKFIAVTANNNREMSAEDIDRRLPMYLEAFSSMVYVLNDFRIALHIRPQPVGDAIKLAMARADLYGMDAQVGGAVSGYVKAGRSLNMADRITRGERPYAFSVVVEVRVRRKGEVNRLDLDALDKQLQEAKSFLDSMNLQSKQIRDGPSAMVCHRFMYLPLPPHGLFEPRPVPTVKGLTKDFVAITPIAFRRRPVMPRDGLYLGRDKLGRKVFWNPSVLDNPHMIIIGPVGSGKSTLVKTMLFRLEQVAKYTGTGRPPAVIIVDPAGEYEGKADLLRENGLQVTVVDLCEKKYNPLLLSGLEPCQRASRLVDYVFPNVLKDLQPFQKQVLYDGLMLAYRNLAKIDPYSRDTWSDERAALVTMARLYEYVSWRRSMTEKRVASKGGSPELDPAVSALYDLERRLRAFATGPFALDRTDVTLNGMLEKGGVYILSFRTRAGEGQVRMSDEMQRLLVWSLLEHVASYMTAQRITEGVRLIVVIDEAHKFLRGHETEVPLSQHLREGRKFGVSYVVVTHILDDLVADYREALTRKIPAVVSMASTCIVFKQGNQEDARRVMEMLNMTSEEMEELMGLPLGEAFLKWGVDPRPLRFEVEPDGRALVRKRESRWEALYSAQ